MENFEDIGEFLCSPVVFAAETLGEILGIIPPSLVIGSSQVDQPQEEHAKVQKDTAHSSLLQGAFCDCCTLANLGYENETLPKL